jgi:hypothetical protein
MQLQHVNVKLLVNRLEEHDLEPLIPVFHSWIRDQGLGENSGELLLDVADYRHVPEGPGVVLIGHEANYSVDNTGNRPGVRYNRKAPLDGSNQDRLHQAARAALLACQRLESEPLLQGKLGFNGQEIELFFNDRMLVPNREGTRETVEPDLTEFLGRLFRGGEYSVSFVREPRELFGVSVKSARTFPVASLLANLDA